MQYLGTLYTDVEDVWTEKIKFAPNPVTERLTLYNMNYGDHIQVITIEGKVILQTIAREECVVINMSEYNPGIYLLRVGENISRFIKK